jgi:MoxR-like ATPase
VKEMAGPVLAHRLILSPAARMKGVDGRVVVDDLLGLMPIPGARLGHAR